MRISRLAHEQSGFTLIEVLVAIVILIVGILGMMIGFATARQLSTVSERHSTMALVANREIERLEGLGYANLAMTSAPGLSSSPASPDYYVLSGSPEGYEYSQTNGVSEPVVVDAANGQVTAVQSWSEGSLSGSIYDFVTWVTDHKCSPGCLANQNYKRITVAVTLSGTRVLPSPVYTSSVIADPNQAPQGGVSNGTAGNPLSDPATTCADSQGITISCTSPILGGNPNTFFLHDWPATGGTPQAPSADHATRGTAGILGGLLCTTSQLLATILGNIAGCPVPDLMDTTPPSGTSLYHYSTDQCGNTCYPGGQLLAPTCSNGTGCGTGSTSDCSGGSWSGSLLSVQTGFWVSAPLSASMTLTGDGGISMFTQMTGSTNAVASFCIEIYDVPPSGSAGSLSDLLAWPPVALGGAGYVPATNPSTGSNWPTSPSQVAYTFNFRGSSGAVSIAAGHRIGVRVWAKATVNTALDLLFDNASYPTRLELNSR